MTTFLYTVVDQITFAYQIHLVIEDETKNSFEKINAIPSSLLFSIKIKNVHIAVCNKYDTRVYTSIQSSTAELDILSQPGYY